MLKINLLPIERRRLRRTPLYAFIPLVVGVALVVGSLALAWNFWSQQEELEKERASLEGEVKSLEAFKAQIQQKKAEVDALRAKIASYANVAPDRHPIDWGEILEDIQEVVSKYNGMVYLSKIAFNPSVSLLTGDLEAQPGGRWMLSLTGEMVLNLFPEPLTPQSNPRVTIEMFYRFLDDLRDHPRLKYNPATKTGTFFDMFPKIKISQPSPKPGPLPFPESMRLPLTITLISSREP